MGILPVPGHGQDGHGTSRGSRAPLAQAAAPTLILGLGSADNRCAEVCPAGGRSAFPLGLWTADGEWTSHPKRRARRDGSATGIPPSASGQTLPVTATSSLNSVVSFAILLPRCASALRRRADLRISHSLSSSASKVPITEARKCVTPGICHGHPARAGAWPGWPWHVAGFGSATGPSCRPDFHARPRKCR
jgi:hypothetical protein